MIKPSRSSTRRFDKPQSLGTLDPVRADIVALEKKRTERLIGEIVKVSS
jgi:hypothetical protein